jgi:hypothetical protein
MQQVKEIMNEDDDLQGNLKVAISPEISSFPLITSLTSFVKEYTALSLCIKETDHFRAFDLSKGNVIIHPSKREKI